MKAAIAYIVAILGVALSQTNFLAVVHVIVAGVDAVRELVSSPASDPSLLGAVIGETMIAIASHGLWAIVPAALLYAALAGFRVRKGWFYSCTQLAAIYFLFVPPFATVYGIILLVALRRRKSEFASVNPASPPSTGEFSHH
jgi:hypothetical protein